ncbi:MAG: hypothetical protein Kow00128_19400 [Deltaproteobacteria bacterium]
MKSLGISITRNRLFAVVRELSLLSAPLEVSCSVPCEEPFGGPKDFSRLAEEIRKKLGGKPLPPAVLSIPPSWTYLRRVTLPVSDLPRAKKLHLAELEGNLPIEDEEILSDILPSQPGEAGTFLAIAARRSRIESVVSAVTEAGFRLDRVVTDHVALLLAALSETLPASGLLVSTLNDLLILRVEGTSLLRARQFPWDLEADSEERAGEIEELLSAEGADGSSVPIRVFGEIPPFLSGRITGSAGASSDERSPIAFGAALVPSFLKETGGFSLRTSAETEGERIRERTRTRIAIASAAVAVLALAGSVEIARYAGNEKVARIRSQIRKEFTEAVPGARVIVRETAQIREKIRSLARQRKELGADVPDLSVLLANVSAALPAEGSIRVREAAYESGRLRLAGEASSGQVVESFRAALAGKFGQEAEVSVQESEGSVRGKTVKYTILIQPRGNGHAS